ncbi:MAG: hypothetical protein AB1847_02500 [bacterium]
MKKIASLSIHMFSTFMFMFMFLSMPMVTLSCFAQGTELAQEAELAERAELAQGADLAEEAVCPDKTFICPLGDEISIRLCWDWDILSCQMCSFIEDEVDEKCEHPNCSEEWLDRSDGCSAPVFSEEMTEIFGDACYIHDLCYSSPGQAKSDCDREFLSNMLQVCSFPGVPNMIGGETCQTAAQIAYRAVVEFAQSYYDKDQVWVEDHCYDGPWEEDICSDSDL